MMKKAYVFPGQGAQFSGMGKDLMEQSAAARARFEEADDLLGFSISKIMFEGTADELKATRVTQPAVFLHAMAAVAALGESFQPDMTAGHSLGEFSALVAAGSLSFKDGLLLVSQRAEAMQKACEAEPSTMAAVLGLADEVVEEVCASVKGVVVAANYNCPGQLVISGALAAVQEAAEKMKAAGAKRALLLPVGGAFHSPLMAPAASELRAAIEATHFAAPLCPVYQNVSAAPSTEPKQIQTLLIEQLTAPVRWTQSVQRMVADGATEFTELGPGAVLKGLIKKIAPEAQFGE